MLSIKQIIPEGFCLKCRYCCRFAEKDSAWFPRLLKEESSLLEKVKSFRPVKNSKDRNFLCPLLNLNDNKCSIYDTRPFECSLYPFLLNRDTAMKKIFVALDLNCPFACQNFTQGVFRKYADDLIAELKKPESISIIRANSPVIQSYKDVMNLKELIGLDEAE